MMTKTFKFALSSALMAIGCSILFTQSASAQILEGFGSQPKFSSPPSGKYRFILPNGFTLFEDENNPDAVNMGGKAGYANGVITIRHVPVMLGALPAQLLLNSRDKELSKLPNFTVLETRKASIALRPAMILIGRYDYVGNKAIQQVIEEAYVVVGEEGYVIRLETAFATYQNFVPALTLIYRSFMPSSVQPQLPEETPIAPMVPEKKANKRSPNL